MKFLNTLTHSLIVMAFVFGLAACNDGEAENAGEKLDEIATEAGNAVEDACEKVKEGVKAEETDC